MRKKRLSWTDPLNHKKRAQTTFLQDFSFGPRLQCTFLLCYFSTTFLSQVELFVEMSSPSLKSTAKYTSFPVIWVSISFINDPRFLLIFSHNCASNLWLMKFFMKQKQYHSSTGEKRKGWNEILFGNQSFYLVPTVLTSTNTVTHKCKQNRKCKYKYCQTQIQNRRRKECWNEILFGTQSFSPGLTVKYILPPPLVRKRNDKCESKKRGEDRAIDFWKSYKSNKHQHQHIYRMMIN